MRLLVVRLGSLGDLVHALPAVAALRGRFPDADIDWVVDAPHRELLDLVPVLSRRYVWHRWQGLVSTLRQLRRRRYDIAYDLQGLIKSAALARGSGARRIVGFAPSALREPAAAWLYSERRDPGAVRHVIEKNLALVAPEVGVLGGAWAFPLLVGERPVVSAVRASLGEGSDRFVIVNPGASWETKRWPPNRFGAVAAFVRRVHHLRSVVVWGPGEEHLAADVIGHAGGAAVLAPPTSLADLLALCREAALVVSGDTGPLQLASAVGTPVVAIFGPTDPGRNGPWAAADRAVSRFTECRCHHRRRCRAARWCLSTISVDEVCRDVSVRLSASPREP